MTGDLPRSFASCRFRRCRSFRRFCATAAIDVPKKNSKRIKKGVGLAIGQVQSEILDTIYSRYPDLDDLT